nr:unnamed protein product [Callosobruchus chinensis]
MADLDDFFAKKDRKKSKGSKKFSTTEEVAKKLEDSAKKTEKVKKEPRNAEGEDTQSSTHDQDEWKDFEEEKKDYSGLKIGNMTIGSNADDNASTTKTSSNEQQQEDDQGPESDRKVGPWKRIEPNEGSQTQVEEPPKQEKRPEPQQPNVVKGAYVPPSMRAGAGGGGPQQQQPTRLKSKVAPDIHNEDFFPTLSKTNDHKKNRTEGGSFEVVQHSRMSNYRQAEQSKMNTSQGPKLNLGNRYNTLSNDS